MSPFVFVLPILSILVGIVIFAIGLRHLMNLFIQMIWLNVKVCNQTDDERNSGRPAKYNFTSGFMFISAYGPIIGLTFVLIGIKYLPI